MKHRILLAQSMIAAVVAVSLAACGSAPKLEQPGTTTQPGQSEQPGQPQPPQQPTVTELFVNPATGLDSNDGSKAAPLKTIKRAIELFKPGMTVNLADGTYNTASGETWEYNTPDGLILLGDEGGAVLDGEGSGLPTAFVRQGSLSLRGITAKNMGSLVYGEKTSLPDVKVVLDYVKTEKVNGVLEITGSDQVSLKKVSVSQAMTFANLSRRVSVTANDLQVSNCVPHSINGLLRVFYVSDESSQDQVKGEFNSVGFTNCGGLYLGEQSQFVFRNANFKNVGKATTPAQPTLNLANTSKLTLEDSIIENAPDQGINATSTTSVKLLRSEIRDGSAIGLISQGTLEVVDGKFSGNAGRQISVIGGTADVRGSSFAGGAGMTGIQVGNATLKLRSSKFETASNAVLLQSSSKADLGTAAEPGQNSFIGGPGVYMNWNSGTLQAVGNTWRPNVQGADASGQYPNSSSVTGSANGQNFRLLAGVSIQF